MSYIAGELEKIFQEELKKIKEHPFVFEKFEEYRVLEQALENVLNSYRIREGGLVFGDIAGESIQVGTNGKDVIIEKIHVHSKASIDSYQEAENIKKILEKNHFEITHSIEGKDGENTLLELGIIAQRHRKEGGTWILEDIILEYKPFRGIDITYSPGAAKVVEEIAKICGIRTGKPRFKTKRFSF